MRIVADESSLAPLATEAGNPLGYQARTRLPYSLLTHVGIMTHIRNWLYRFYLAVQRVLVPGLRNSEYTYRETLLFQVNPQVLWLDLGCGHQLLPDWMPSSDEDQRAIVNRARMVVGIDRDFVSLRRHKAIKYRVCGDIQQLPFRNESFDLVTANVVVEHVANPAALLVNVHRVLRPDGIFLFHTPNLWNYGTLIARLLPYRLKMKLVAFLQERKEEDVFPTHYRLNTPRLVRVLAQQNGFRILELRLTNSSAQALMLGPLVILELLWIRILQMSCLETLRSNIVAVLQKAASFTGSLGESSR